jgi:hypothetical protein
MGSSGVGTLELKRQFEEFKQQDGTRQQLAEVWALTLPTSQQQPTTEWWLPLALMNRTLPAPSFPSRDEQN